MKPKEVLDTTTRYICQHGAYFFNCCGPTELLPIECYIVEKAVFDAILQKIK